MSRADEKIREINKIVAGLFDKIAELTKIKNKIKIGAIRETIEASKQKNE